MGWIEESMADVEEAAKKLGPLRCAAARSGTAPLTGIAYEEAWDRHERGVCECEVGG